MNKSEYSEQKKVLAFSFVEALISMLIVGMTVVLSMPAVDKKIQNDQKLASLEAIPVGMISYFDLEECPKGWSKLSDTFNGRTFKVAGNYQVCDILNTDGTCSKSYTSNNTTTEYCYKPKYNNQKSCEAHANLGYVWNKVEDAYGKLHEFCQYTGTEECTKSRTKLEIVTGSGSSSSSIKIANKPGTFYEESVRMPSSEVTKLVALADGSATGSFNTTYGSTIGKTDYADSQQDLSTKTARTSLRYATLKLNGGGTETRVKSVALLACKKD